MSLPDNPSRVNSVRARSDEEYKEIKKLTGAKKLENFELLMRHKAKLINSTRKILDLYWNNDVNSVYIDRTAASRMFPIKEFSTRLDNVERCCTEYTAKGPVFACRQTLACPVCSQHAAYAFASQRTAMLFEQLENVDFVKVFEIVIDFGDAYLCFAAEKFDDLAELRTQIRDFFTKRDNSLLLKGSKLGYPKTYRILDMFIHSAPSTATKEMIFPHLHIVAIPVSTRTTLADFVETMQQACKGWNVKVGENFLPSETFYAKKEKGRKTKNPQDFFRRMVYLAKLIKASMHGGWSYLNTVTAAPKTLKQKTSKSGTSFNEQSKTIKMANKAPVIIRFDAELNQFRFAQDPTQ